MQMTLAEQEWHGYVIGKVGKEELTHPENQARVAEREAQRREQQLISIGYNLALLDHAQFPIDPGSDAPLTREKLQATVSDLREALGWNKTNSPQRRGQE